MAQGGPNCFQKTFAKRHGAIGDDKFQMLRLNCSSAATGEQPLFKAFEVLVPLYFGRIPWVYDPHRQYPKGPQENQHYSQVA